MREIAPGLHQIALFPRHGVNAYLAGDVLVDAGYRFSAKKLLGAVAGREISAHAITHAHADHAGSSARVARELSVDVWAGAADVEALEEGRPVVGDVRGRGLVKTYGRFPAVRVGRALHEGDQVGGFRVVEVPGHSPGHVALWREADRVLVAGDVFFNMSIATTVPGLRHPPAIFTPDVEANRAAQRRLAELEPQIVVFGHGPPLHDAAPKLRAFLSSG